MTESQLQCDTEACKEHWKEWYTLVVEAAKAFNDSVLTQWVEEATAMTVAALPRRSVGKPGHFGEEVTVAFRTLHLDLLSYAKEIFSRAGVCAKDTCGMFEKLKQAYEPNDVIEEYCAVFVRRDLKKASCVEGYESVVLGMYTKYIDLVLNAQRRRWTQISVFMGFAAAIFAMVSALYSKGGNLEAICIAVLGFIMLYFWSKMFKYISSEMRVHFSILREMERHLPARIFTYGRALDAKTKHPSNTKLEGKLITTVIYGLICMIILLIVAEIFYY